MQMTALFCVPPSPPLSSVGDSQDRFYESEPKDVSPTIVTSARRLGMTEASYFLPSRDSGVNDMYLQLGFASPRRLITTTRLSLVWAILRLRHPLLSSRVVMYDYDNIQFEYVLPTSPGAAIQDAINNSEYRTTCENDLVDNYLNGPRTLSNDRLSYLVLSRSDVSSGSSGPVQHELIICATHFLGDGMALHQFANDLFSMLGSDNSDDEFSLILGEEWEMQQTHAVALPTPLEDRLPPGNCPSSFYEAACRVDFQNIQNKQIGGQAFPKQTGRPRHTIVPTISIDSHRTKKMLRVCKANGVSISSALFALCNVAWIRASDAPGELPTLMYSALNLRPHLQAEKALNDSYWFLAIGYFNVILPTFLPQMNDARRTFWHRARLAKEQSTAAAKSPMLIPRSRLMAEERAARSIVWAKEDDEKGAGIWTPPPSPKKEPKVKVPTTALMGLSLLGNLDGIYKHASFGEITLTKLTTGSRQRSGGMLLFGYTFVGKLWVSLGYDENGFEPTLVQRFWAEVMAGIDEFLDV